ncbi:MAG: hypothetical protein AAF298_29180 [Cyanobacteria bacterium P01_A01_bin.40]
MSYNWSIEQITMIAIAIQFGIFQKVVGASRNLFIEVIELLLPLILRISVNGTKEKEVPNLS